MCIKLVNKLYTSTKWITCLVTLFKFSNWYELCVKIETYNFFNYCKIFGIYSFLMSLGAYAIVDNDRYLSCLF